MNATALNSHPIPAGLLALLVHVVFFAFLIFGVNWRAVEPPGMVVDVWSNIPDTSAPLPQKAAPPPEPKPEPVKKIEPKAPPPAPTPKADIAIKAKPAKVEKPKPEPPKPNKQDLQKQEQLKQEQARQAEVARQQQALAEVARQASARQAAAQQSVVSEYSDRIRSKIRQKLNRSLCGDGNPQLLFDIALLPTGQILGRPVLRKSSGIAACDKAVEDAILLSDPLPVPTQPDIFAYFRDLHLNFRPNE